MACLLFWKKKRLDVRLGGVQTGFRSERKVKAIPRRRAKKAHGGGTDSGKSGTRNLEAESIRRRAENTGGC